MAQQAPMLMSNPCFNARTPVVCRKYQGRTMCGGVGIARRCGRLSAASGGRNRGSDGALQAKSSEPSERAEPVA